MKKWLIFLSTILLAACSSRPATTGPVATAAVSPQPDQLVAPYRDSIVPDGDLADWNGIQFIAVAPQTGVFDLENGPSHNTSDPANLSYSFAVAHDDSALYVAILVRDDQLMVDSTTPGDVQAEAWKDDAVEVFIDGNHNHAPDARVRDGSETGFGGEFSLVINGAATSDYSGWPGTFGDLAFWQGATNYQKVLDGERPYVYEYRLTWHVMGDLPGPGSTIGFTLAVEDDDDGGERDFSLYWKARPSSGWKDESGWGDLYLEPK